MYTVHDLWTRNISSEPRSFIAAATAPVTTTNHDSVDGVDVELLPLSLEQIMVQRNIWAYFSKIK